MIELNYIGVDNPEIAKKRVLERIARGGHGVSAETIDRRFISSVGNLKKVFKLCDEIKV